jgi:nucleotide-binding universal stress UspA family protein
MRTVATAEYPDVDSDKLRPHGPVVVATDGRESSESALRVAARLATHASAELIVLAVLEPVPLVAADYGLLLPPDETDEARKTALRREVESQLAAVLGSSVRWTLELREGDPAAVIARAARELRARAVFLGLGHHDMLDRVFGRETALHTVRLSRVPVLAVAPGRDTVPSRAVIAIDFSAASVRAARSALEMFDTVSRVYLAHVAPRMEVETQAFAAWLSTYDEGVGPSFERVKAELDVASSVVVETVTLQGKPAREIANFARSVDADLIVTGSRGAGLMDRILVGSTATGLIRAGVCSVYAVPSPTGAARLGEVAATERSTIAPDAWARELEAFTQRNAGRRAALEVDDPELGAQSLERDYSLLGVAFDHQDGAVEIMVGDFEGTKHHFTHNIADVKGVDLLQDQHGRDWILRIAHGRGQTILTLVR